MPCNKVDKPELSAYQQTPEYEKTMAAMAITASIVKYS